MVTVKVSDLPTALKSIGKQKGVIIYQLIDGGEVSLLLLSGYNSFEEYGKLTENISGKGITSVTAETLAFRSDLSN